MLLPRTHIKRIPPLIRPLKPPRPSPSNQSRYRPFTQNTHLRLLLSSTSTTTRPQLPFLHQSPSPLPPSQTVKLYRLLSTSPRAQYYRRTLTGGLKLGIGFYVILLLGYVIQLGVKQEVLERRYPTPGGWGWKRRWCLRSARDGVARGEAGEEGMDWVWVGGYVRDLLGSLEDELRKERDGEGDDGDVLVEGLGRMGIDISRKDEEWRRGYFLALMCGAKIAEHLDGWVKDDVLRVAAPKDLVFPSSSSSSSDENGTKPLLKGVRKKVKGDMKPENCTQAYDAPEVFYMKILTGTGFTTREKVDAALGYADWLDFKGLSDTAREVYDWGMDVAVKGMEDAVAESGKERDVVREVVDPTTGVLTGKATNLVSENVMRVSTALAVHHAKNNDLPTALSIFLSLLRARRDINSRAPSPASPSTPPPQQQSILSQLSSLLTPPAFPPPPPSGNTPPSTPSPCTEAALMTYIGEIIFSSTSTEDGLAWTRDAVDLAEAGLLDGDPDERKCRECLATSLDNWKTMLRTLVRRAEDREVQLIEGGNSTDKSSSWPKSLWSSKGGKEGKLQEMAKERKRWEAEERVLEERVRGLRGVLVAGDTGGGWGFGM